MRRERERDEERRGELPSLPWDCSVSPPSSLALLLSSSCYPVATVSRNEQAETAVALNVTYKKRAEQA
jgi:hypothetical protein